MSTIQIIILIIVIIILILEVYRCVCCGCGSGRQSGGVGGPNNGNANPVPVPRGINRPNRPNGLANIPRLDSRTALPHFFVANWVNRQTGPNGLLRNYTQAQLQELIEYISWSYIHATYAGNNHQVVSATIIMPRWDNQRQRWEDDPNGQIMTVQ